MWIRSSRGRRGYKWKVCGGVEADMVLGFELWSVVEEVFRLDYGAA